MPNPNTDFTAGQVLTSSQANRFPRGVMGSVYRTTGDVSVTTSATDITSMTVTFTAVASRLYKASWGVAARKETAGGYTQINFTDSANVLYGYSIANTLGGQFVNLSGVSIISGLTAGSKTFKLRGFSENNTSTIFATAAAPCQLLIEDIGPA